MILIVIMERPIPNLFTRWANKNALVFRLMVWIGESGFCFLGKNGCSNFLPLTYPSPWCLRNCRKLMYFEVYFP